MSYDRNYSSFFERLKPLQKQLLHELDLIVRLYLRLGLTLEQIQEVESKIHDNIYRTLWP